MIQKIKKLVLNVSKQYRHNSIQFTIALSFTVISILCMAVIGVTFYSRFVAKAEEMTAENSDQILYQTGINLETYIRNMMRISDSMYYSIIKNTDFAVETMDDEMNLLYEANKDNLISIACFTEDGTIIGATPVATQKLGVDITKQEWFITANSKIENLHFSLPHVQELFDDSNYRYYWVVSLSRVVELTKGGDIERGVLLVDMNHSGIEQLFKKVNASNSYGYTYLIDSSGEIIYHPKQKLIYANLLQENNIAAADYEDGRHRETFHGSDRTVTIKTVGYTGWKVVSVTLNKLVSDNVAQTKYFVILLIVIAILVLVVVNQVVSAMLAKPIKKLDDSIRVLESGNFDLDVYVGGSHEIRHLGNTINSMVSQLRQLMDDIVVEQEEKRKSELDALQSQINPHFLYNTLDSIVWMIEDERYQEAISMITALASLFRISLSKGKTIISIKDEIEHAQNYLNIQKVRYKNKFIVYFEIEESIYEYSTIKLILQPLIENAIYYGVEYMDGDGEITIRGYRKGDDIYLEVIDNGLGMTKDTISLLLTDDSGVRKRGSGVGLKNVHQRIQLGFGYQYGLEIESEPDEGTIIRIHLPSILFTRSEGKGELNDS